MEKSNLKYGLYFSNNHVFKDEKIHDKKICKKDTFKILTDKEIELIESNKFINWNKIFGINNLPLQKEQIIPPIKPKSTYLINSEKIQIKRALVIGINYFGTENELNGCIRDIDLITDILIKKFNYSQNNIYRLSDEQNDVNKKPTRNNIVNSVINLVNMSNDGDTIFIHYSGHGTLIPCKNNDEQLNTDAPNQDDAICPVDFEEYNDTLGLITDDELYNILVEPISKKNIKLRAFFDCCHSGSGLDLPLIFVGDTVFAKSNINQNQSNSLLISGCRDNQTSADSYIDGKFNGALTWSILKTINENNIEKMSWTDFYLNIKLNLRGKYEQIPMLSVGKSNIGNLTIDL